MIWHGFLDQELSLRLCRVLLHSLWQVALIVLVARVAARLWPRRSVERDYAIQVAALLASLVIMPVTFAIMSSGASRAAEQISLIEPPSAIRTEVSPDRPDEHPVEMAAVPRVDLPPTSFAPTNALPQPIAGRTTLWMKLSPWAAGLYVIGVVLMLVRLGIGVWRASRLGHRGRILNDGPLAEFVRTIAAKWSMRAVPALVQVEEILVPKVVGLFRPCILLPAAALTGLSAAELEMILIHELAHLRRYDMWVNLLQRLAEAVLFFNPAAWYLSRRMSALREYCCDEMACQTAGPGSAQARTEYAMALLRVVELARIAMQSPASNAAREHDSIAALAASGRSPSQLRKRVASLFGEPLNEPLRLSVRGVIAVASVLSLMLLGVTSWSRGDGARDAAAARTQFDKVAAQRKELTERSRTDGKGKRPATNTLSRERVISMRGGAISDTSPGFCAHADFSATDFTNSKLSGGRDAFVSANFARAKFFQASLMGGDAAFQTANFEKTALTRAVLAGGISSFQGSSFKDSDLRNAKLSGGVGAFQGATFEGADLSNTTLSAEGGGFQLASFDHANLSGAKIICDSLTAFQNVSVSGAIFCNADLSAIDYRSLMSCVFPLESPPRYNSATRFPKGFDPAKQGWLLKDALADESQLSKHVVLVTAENQPPPGSVPGVSRTFPALVIANDGDNSILLSASWGAVPFQLKPEPILLGRIYLADTYETVKVLAYDEKLGIGKFSVRKRLEPVPTSAFAGDVKTGDELTELRINSRDAVRFLRVLAVDEPFNTTSVVGQPIAVEHAIRFDGKLNQNPGTLLLKDGKIAAVFLNNNEDEFNKIKHYALPIKAAQAAFAQLRPTANAAQSPAQSESKTDAPSRPPRPMQPIYRKNYVIAPWINTELQREWGPALDAYVLVDGNSFYTKSKTFNFNALDWEQLARDLERFGRGEKAAVNFHVFYFEREVDDTQLLNWALEGFGKQRANFGRSYVGGTYTGTGKFQDVIDATTRKMKGRQEGPEPGVGNDIVRVHPVRTFASCLMNDNADCVVQIVQPLDGSSGRAWPANVQAAILETVPKADVAQKKKLLIKFQFKLPAAEKTMDWIHDASAKELAKELGYEEGDAEGSAAPG